MLILGMYCLDMPKARTGMVLRLSNSITMPQAAEW